MSSAEREVLDMVCKRNSLEEMKSVDISVRKAPIKSFRVEEVPKMEKTVLASGVVVTPERRIRTILPNEHMQILVNNPEAKKYSSARRINFHF